MRGSVRGFKVTLLALAFAPLAAGCIEDEDGYAKVVERDQERLTLHAAPEPPPVTPGMRLAATEIAIPANLPSGVSESMIREGQQLFGTVCTACHGPGGRGSGLAPALDDAEWLQIGGEFAEIAEVIRAGVPNPQEYPAPMPPLGGGNFDPEEVNALAAYVWALSRQTDTEGAN